MPPSLGADASYSLNVFCMKGINTSWVLQTSVPSDRQKFTGTNSQRSARCAQNLYLNVGTFESVHF